MAKVRVFYRPDGTVAVNHPNIYNRKINILATFMQPFPENVDRPIGEILWAMERPRRIHAFFNYYNMTIIYLKTEQEWLDGVFYRAMTHKHYDKKTKQKIPNPLDGLPYDDIDHTELPLDAKGKKLDPEKWRGSKGQGVHIDNTVVPVMKQIEAKQSEIDAELEKQNPDPVKMIRADREIETIKKNHLEKLGLK